MHKNQTLFKHIFHKIVWRLHFLNELLVIYSFWVQINRLIIQTKLSLIGSKCNLVSAQLFIEFGDVVIPLRLKQVAGYRFSQMVFLRKVSYFKLSPSVTRSVGQFFFRRESIGWAVCRLKRRICGDPSLLEVRNRHILRERLLWRHCFQGYWRPASDAIPYI